MGCLHDITADEKDELQKIEREIAEIAKVDPYERICLRRLLAPRVKWYDNHCLDFWTFIKNEHPVISIRLAPKRHPYTRRERFWNLIVAVCLSFYFAALSAQLKASCISSRELDRLAGSSLPDPTDISPCTNYGQYVISVGFGGCVAGVGLILKACAECGCVQFSWSCTRVCCESIGRAILYLSVVWALVLFIAGIVTIAQTDGVDALPFIINAAISQGSSWCFVVLWLGAKYIWLYRKESKDPKAAAEYMEYRQCRAVEVKTRQQIEPGWQDDNDPNSVGVGSGTQHDAAMAAAAGHRHGGSIHTRYAVKRVRTPKWNAAPHAGGTHAPVAVRASDHSAAPAPPPPVRSPSSVTIHVFAEEPKPAPAHAAPAAATTAPVSAAALPPPPSLPPIVPPRA